MTLRQYLLTHGHSHAAFAGMIDVSAPTVTRYVNGLRTPDDKEMAAIYKATKGLVTANDFHKQKPVP